MTWAKFEKTGPTHLLMGLQYHPATALSAVHCERSDTVYVILITRITIAKCFVQAAGVDFGKAQAQISEKVLSLNFSSS